jgi:hypothetical protein
MQSGMAARLHGSPSNDHCPPDGDYFEQRRGRKDGAAGSGSRAPVKETATWTAIFWGKPKLIDFRFLQRDPAAYFGSNHDNRA